MGNETKQEKWLVLEWITNLIPSVIAGTLANLITAAVLAYMGVIKMVFFNKFLIFIVLFIIVLVVYYEAIKYIYKDTSDILDQSLSSHDKDMKKLYKKLMDSADNQTDQNKRFTDAIEKQNIEAKRFNDLWEKSRQEKDGGIK